MKMTDEELKEQGFWQWDEDHPRCCDEDLGGSHYHCAKCNGVTGMMGHSMKKADGTWGFSCEK